MKESPYQYRGAAGGKAILIGEHLVVYGAPAVVVGLDRGAIATAVSGGTQTTLRVRKWDVVVSESDTEHDLGRALAAVVSAAKTTQSLSIEAEIALPPGGGLGCSAALGVAVARALLPVARMSDIASLAMAWERVFHGNPSGVDAAVAIEGGSLFFRKHHAPRSVRLSDSLTLCVGNTGVGSSTREMVDRVAQVRQSQPQTFDTAYRTVEELAYRACAALEQGDHALLGDLMNTNQAALETLGVSGDAIERMCALARDAGALGAKLTGAGGGGSVIALAPSRAVAATVLAQWSEAGFSGFVTDVQRTRSASSVSMRVEHAG